MVFPHKAVVLVVAICPSLSAFCWVGTHRSVEYHFLHIIIPQSIFSSRYWCIWGRSGHLGKYANPHPFVKPFPLHSLSSLSLLIELLLTMQGPHRLSSLQGSLPDCHNQMGCLLSLDHREFYNLYLQHFTLYEICLSLCYCPNERVLSR